MDVLAQTGGRAVVIWLLLLVLAVLALAGLSLPTGIRRPRQITAWLAANAERERAAEARRAAEAAERLRYAEEIAVAVRGAAATAERRREECRGVQERVERAWQAYQEADAALTRARRAAAYAAPASIPPPAEREQALRRSAQAAYRRGDLSDTQLLDALTHRNGWDPDLHPVEQELILARAAVKHRFATYRQMLDLEQEAWRASDVAAAAVQSLRREYTVAQTAVAPARSNWVAVPVGQGLRPTPP